MTSTNEYRNMLQGPMRQWMKDAGGEAKWADAFCDGLLLRLIEFEGSCKIHLWSSRDGTFQINIDSENKGAYTNDVSSDPLACIGERLGNQLVRGTDAGKERARS